MSIGENIRRCRKQAGLNQGELGKLIGVSASAITQLENNDTKPKLTNMALLADALKCTTDELLGRRISQFAGTAARLSHVIAMIDYVDLRAGAGAEAIMPEYIKHEPIPVTKQFLNGIDPKNLVAIKVVGDSMEPAIKPDEYVIIDKVNGRDFYPVDGIYLINKDGAIQIKRLHFKGIKGIDIISDNHAYPKENTIDDSITLEIIGKLFKQIKNLGALAIKD